MHLSWIGAASPSISVCVPTFDASERLFESLIQSLSTYTPVLYEVVLVDCESARIGYTKPQNLAMKSAKSDILIAANDDVVVADGWLEPMLHALNAGAWCVTPDMTYSDGPQVFAPYFMMWRKWAWEEIGGLDEQFIHWCSDIDIARRLVDAGHPPVRVTLPNSIQHDPGTTIRRHQEMVTEHNSDTVDDLDRFAKKWGIAAEQEKGRLAQLVCFGAA